MKKSLALAAVSLALLVAVVFANRARDEELERFRSDYTEVQALCHGPRGCHVTVLGPGVLNFMPEEDWRGSSGAGPCPPGAAAVRF